MKFKGIGSIVIAATMLTGCVSSQQMEKSNHQVQLLNQHAQVITTQLQAVLATLSEEDRHNADYCYLNGEPYSKGAVVDNMRCSTAFMVTDGPDDMEWQPNR